MKEFHSFLKFSEFLSARALAMYEAQKAGMEHACKVVQREAKKEIGTYQDGAGDFVAWAELADYTKEDRVAQGYTENDPGLRSGEMRDSIEWRADATEGHVGSDNDKLVWFELGSFRQPPRSVLGLAAVHCADDVRDILGEAVVTALAAKGPEGFSRIVFDAEGEWTSFEKD